MVCEILWGHIAQLIFHFFQLGVPLLLDLTIDCRVKRMTRQIVAIRTGYGKTSKKMSILHRSIRNKKLMNESEGIGNDQNIQLKARKLE